MYAYSVAYNKLGELTQRVLGNYGKRTAITYTIDEPTGRLANTSADPEGKPEVMDLAYSYDPAGNLLRIADSPGSSLPVETQCFRYDHLRRLTTAWTPLLKSATNCVSNPGVLGGPARYWHDYTYDAAGNRLTRIEHDSAGISNTTCTYPAAGTSQPHTLTQVVRTGPHGSTLDTYDYDQAGNTIERVVGGTTQTLQWDAEGRVEEISDTTGATSYVHDADGNRLIRRDPTAKTLYLAGQELRYTNATGGSEATRYYTHLGTSIAVRTPAGLTWTVTDHHNTSTAMIRDIDMAIQRRRTLPFGEVRGTAPTWWAGDKGFLSGTADPTGLTHLGARLYDPAVGRFISIDPIMDLASPQQMHGYAYANSNPLTWSDPSGLYIFEDTNGGGLRTAGSVGGKGGRKASQTIRGTASAKTNVSTLPAPGQMTQDDAAMLLFGTDYDHIWGGIQTIMVANLMNCYNHGDRFACENPEAINDYGIVSAYFDALNPLADLEGCAQGDPAACGWLLAGFVPFGKAGKLVDLARNLRYLDETAEVLEFAGDTCRRMSFTADTKVLMADGTTKSIGDIMALPR